MALTPFTVSIPQPVLDDLARRLETTRWPDAIEGAGWEYGTDRAWLREMMGWWRSDFDWREQEAAINRLPQYLARIDGQDIHLIRQPAERRQGSAMPILLLHGWPSSFLQMRTIIPLLADPASHGGDPADAFEVIAVSLPGFGFSSIPSQRGMSVARIAPMLHALMTDILGHARYGVRGSDLGAGVATQLALAHPDAVIGVHTGGTNPWIQDVPNDLSDAEREFVANAQRWSQEEMAYAMLHSTRPQTLAYALTDSPAGLASWMLEKFRRWSDNDGDVESAIGRDDLLTNLTVYWATGTINASMRLYYETMRDPGLWGRAEVPTAMAMGPRDMFPTPREWAERMGRVDRWTDLPRGGHFLEWEVPELLADDIRAFFRDLR